MIIGDKIVTTLVMRDTVLLAIPIYAIEKHTLVWCVPFEHVDPSLRVLWKMFTTHPHDLLIGRVQKRDRGLTWCPAWIEREVEALTVAAGLRAESKTDA